MSKIIRAMELLGYTPHKGGVCFGVAMMGTQAIIRNQSQAFIDRIMFIQNTSEEKIKSLVEPFDRKIDKKRHDIKIDLLCFFDELSIYQSNESVNEAFKTIVPETQSINNVKKLAYAEKNDGFIYPEIKKNIINLFGYNEFFNLLIKIKNYLGGKSFSIVILQLPICHATQIGFDGKNKQWFSSDHDYVVTGNDTVSDIENVIDNIFFSYQYRGANNAFKMAASLDLCLPEIENKEAEIDLSPLEIYDFNISKLTSSYDKESLCHLISCYEVASRFDEMLALFDKINSLNLPEIENVQLLESQRENGFTLFHFLIEKENKDVLQALFKKVQEMKLSDHAKMRILETKDEDHPSPLILALQYELEDIAQVIIEAINTIEDQTIRAKAIDAKWADTSALCIAVDEGYEKTVQALTSAISNIKENQLRANLLEAKNEDNVPALLVAIDKGHLDIAKLLIKAICGLDDNKLRAKLLEAKDNNTNISALALATKERHTEIIEMLVDAICDIPV